MKRSDKIDQHFKCASIVTVVYLEVCYRSCDGIFPIVVDYMELYYPVVIGCVIDCVVTWKAVLRIAVGIA